jgi:hypothetical protein
MTELSRTLSLSLSVALLATIAACSHSHDEAAATAARLAVVSGAGDAHCAGKSVAVEPAICHAAHADAGSAEAGADAGGMAISDYGPTLFLTEGDDDDCKYHVKWSSPQVDTGASPASVKLALSPRHEGEAPPPTATAAGNATFTVVLTSKVDGKPVTGAPVNIEAFLDDLHPAPNTTQSVQETSPGTYTVGPVAFDASGRWTVRFHIHDECNDGERSPHGHVAFYVQVTR